MPHLAREDITGLTIDVLHTDEFIRMEDHPAEAARIKKKSTMRLGMDMVKAGDADAFVTAGHTGGALATATLHSLRRISGVMRPALTFVFQQHDHTTVLADIGANTDCKPEWLLQFALMGHAYSTRVLGTENPRVALLANGEEDSKGNALTRATAAMLRKTDLNFIGNVEAKDALVAHKTDILIHDGFTGNVLIKTYGATAQLMFNLLKKVARESLRVGLGLKIAESGLRSLKRQIDPMEFGGALLLGVNGVVIVAHGRSNALGIKNAIRQACQSIEANVLEVIKGDIAQHIAASKAAAM